MSLRCSPWGASSRAKLRWPSGGPSRDWWSPGHLQGIHRRSPCWIVSARRSFSVTNFLFFSVLSVQNKPLKLKNREWFFLFLDFFLFGNNGQYPAKIPVSSFESENGARGRKLSPARVSPKLAHFARLAVCKDVRNHCMIFKISLIRILNATLLFAIFSFAAVNKFNQN